jgi:hypothetical protein
MNKKLALVLMVVGFVSLAPQLAGAASCKTGCGFASKVCVRGAALNKIGCSHICRGSFEADKVACVVNMTDCELVHEAYHTCKIGCVVTGKSSQAACKVDRAGCDGVCDAASNPACADGCGALTPVTSYKACQAPIIPAGQTCRAGCNNDGTCIQQTCAATLLGSLAGCTIAFNNCMGGC